MSLIEYGLMPLKKKCKSCYKHEPTSKCDYCKIEVCKDCVRQYDNIDFCKKCIIEVEKGIC